MTEAAAQLGNAPAGRCGGGSAGYGGPGGRRAPDTLDGDPLVGIGTVCRMLGFADRTIRRWMTAGTFPKPDVRFGNRLRWRLSTIEGVMRDGFEVDKRKPKGAC